MALNVGSLVGYLDLDTKGWDRGLSTAQGRVASMAKGSAKVVAGGVIAAGVAAGGALAYSLGKGFARLDSIDAAEKKLTGLGHSAGTVEKIMDNALASVQGTAYGMGDAATTAAGSVAAGIKPGQDLERTLKLVADASTIAGTSMGDMGAIFNKAATSNKIQGEILNQLGDRGIPIVQFLAQELGVTGEEVLELSRKGKIGFAEFQAAMEAGLGGAAQSSGDTFQGAWANVIASVGRIGANLLAGIFPQLAPALKDLQGSLGGLEKAAGPMGEKLGRAFERGLTAATGLVEFFRTGTLNAAAVGALGITPENQGLMNTLIWVRDRALEIPGALQKVRSTASSVAGSVAGVFERGLTAAQGLVTFFQTGTLNAAAVEALGITPENQGLLNILTGIKGILDQVGPAFQTLVDTIVANIPAAQALLQEGLAFAIDLVQKRLDQLAPVVTNVMNLIMEGVAGAQAFWQEHASWLMPTIKAIGDILMWVGDLIFTAFLGAINGVVTMLRGLGQVFGGVVGLIKDLITGDWAGAWDNAKQIFMGVWNLITGFIQVWWNGTILGVFRKGAAKLLSTWTGGLELVKNAPKLIWDFITRGASKLWDDIVGFFSQGGRRMADEVALRGMAVLDWFKNLPGTILGFIKDMPALMIEAAGSIVDGFIQGIKDKIPSVGGAFSALMAEGRSWLPFSPAKKGPFSGKGWTPHSGMAIAEGLAQGIRSGTGAVSSAAGALASAAVPGTSTPSFSPGSATAGAGARGGAAAGGERIVFHVTQNNPIASTDLEQVTDSLQLAAI